MAGKLVAYHDGKRCQVSRIDKIIKKNQNVYRSELKGVKK